MKQRIFNLLKSNQLYLIITLLALSPTLPCLATDDDSQLDVARNLSKNQLYVQLKSGDIRYYNTEDIQMVDMKKTTGSVVINAKNTTARDVYDGNVAALWCVKGTESASNGSFTNGDGRVHITDARGWLESVFMEFKPYAGAERYNVYVKGGDFADYTAVDKELIRDYGTFGRVDVIGLKADTYDLKVVPVVGGNEVAAATNEATGMTVKNFLRAGFAHKNWQGVGAYNDDGTLKDNAVVVYVTRKNAKTVTAKLNTGTFTGLQSIVNAYQKGNVTVPLDIRIIGTLNYGETDELLSSAEGLQIKGKKADSEMNITIEGVGNDATIKGFGMLIRNAKSVEIRNLGIIRCMDDGISLDTDNSNIWIHNIDVFYGKQGSGDHAKGDGSIDVKSDSKYVTVSQCRFWDTGKSSMCGMKSETGPNYITYHHNWFDHSDSRHPRVRTMSVHIWNNYYDGCAKYGAGATMGSSVFVENNYFRATKDPMMISMQGTDAKGSGTFSGEDGGMIKSFGNLYAEKGSSSNYTVITHLQSANDFDCYEASTRDEQVAATYQAKQGGGTYNNFDTDDALMYDYTPDDAADVPTEVTGFYGAGRLQHGDCQYTFNNSKDDTDYAVNTALASLIDNYETSLVGIFGEEALGTGDDDNPGTGDDDPSGSETGDEGVVISASVECNFQNKAPSNSAFTVSGNYSTSKGQATVNGVTYTVCLKMESKTSVSFATDKSMTMTLVFAEGETASVKVDGEKVTSSDNIITYTLPAGSHELTKANTCNLFYIGLAE